MERNSSQAHGWLPAFHKTFYSSLRQKWLGYKGSVYKANRRTSPACQPLVPPFMSLRSAATSAKYLLDTNCRSPHPARPHRQDGRRSESFVQSVLQLWSTAPRRARVGGHAAATCGVPAGLHDEIHVIPCNQGSFAANLF